MPTDTLTFLTKETKKELDELMEELGLKDPRVFVRKAVEDKLLDFKRAKFFRISDHVSAGLRKRGIRPAELISKFKI